MSCLAPPVYLFGILRARSMPGDLGSDGPADNQMFGPCRGLRQGELLGIVSDLRLAEGETPEGILGDPGIAKGLVLHHHRVLDGLLRAATVLPLRFGCAFSGDDAVVAAMSASQSSLLEALGSVEGGMEWGLKIYCDRDRLGTRLAEAEPEIVRLRAEASCASTGKAFFLGRRLERQIEAESERAIGRCLDFVERRLEIVSKRMKQNRPQSAEVHGRDCEMVSNGAFLIALGGEQAFFEIVDDLRAAYAGFGFDFETTGPWPPYSFVDLDMNGEDNAT